MIFGTGRPKFVYDLGGEDESEILLDHFIVDDDNLEDDVIEHESVITKYRDWEEKGEHYLFSGRMNIFRFGNPFAKYQEVMAYKNSLVTLWRHRDHDAFQDSSGNIVLFKVKMEPYYFTQAKYKDVIKLTFKSQKPVDIDKCLQQTITDSVGRTLVDDFGVYINMPG